MTSFAARLDEIAGVVDPRPRLSLKQFVRDGWHVVEPGAEYIDGWHVDAICEHLEAVADGRIQYLLINIPPGHMKSLLVSVFWPAWMWSFRPEWRALFGSYDLTLSIRDAKRTRDVIESEWYRDTFSPAWALSGDQNVKSYYENTRKGFRLALAVGSRGTGFRGDCIVADDPLNAKDRHSQTKREAANDWWGKTMSSRLNNQRTGARIVVMQRLHEEDLSGYLLGQGGYEHLCLPSEFEPKRAKPTAIGWRDPRTVEGELLFPALFPAPVLERAKVDLGGADYAGQHQQRPNPAGGGIFKGDWFRRWRRAELPTVWQELILSWDMTFKDADGTDYVVGQVWGRSGADCYLLAQVRKRMDFVATVGAFSAQCAEWPRAHAKLIEDKANGPAVISVLRRKIPGIIAVEPEGSKLARAHAVSPMIEAGNVYIPADAPWVADFLSECEAFPNGTHDDQVDAMTQALARLGRRSARAWDPDKDAQPTPAARVAHARY